MHTYGKRRPVIRRKNNPGFRLLTFLNSALGIWLLSVIFLQLTGALVGVWYHHRQAESDAAIRHQRLDTEISYRLSHLLNELDTGEAVECKLHLYQELQRRLSAGNVRLHWYSDSNVRNEEAIVSARLQNWLTSEIESLHKRVRDPADALQLLSSAPATPSDVLFPENSNRSALSLILESRAIMSSSEQSQLDTVLPKLGNSPHTREALAQFIWRDLAVLGWRQQVVKFARCPESNPVCSSLDIPKNSVIASVSLDMTDDTATIILTSRPGFDPQFTVRVGAPNTSFLQPRPNSR